MSKTITIAGMGWLGQPLARRLMNLGYSVKGSVSSLEKATMLQKNGLNAFPMEISENGVSGEIKALLSETEYLIIMIPPGLRRNTGADFVLKMVHFLEEIKKHPIRKVILVSSISVYSDAQGHVTENDLPNPSTQAGKQLLQVEQLFVNSPNFKTTVVRFGGLYGGSRQPVNYLSGRDNLSDGNAPVNLIHREDCIGILSETIKQEAFGQIFNAVNPQHPTKEKYYTKKAMELNIPPPHFSKQEEDNSFKQVDSVRVEKILGYSFLHL